MKIIPRETSFRHPNNNHTTKDMTTNDSKVVIRDFNRKSSSFIMLSFMDSENLVNLIKSKTCSKAASSGIDLIIRNWSSVIFSNSVIFSTKITAKCEEPKKLIYRNYSTFSQKDYQSDLSLNIADGNIIT